jgi:hypothetical protein
MNQRTLFDENYALASTQALKNKDIPEDGAKGTILPSYEMTNSGRDFLKRADTSRRLGADPQLCFEKYIDVRTSDALCTYTDKVAYWYRLSLTSSSPETFLESRNRWLTCTTNPRFSSSVLTRELQT